ncbi:MAG: hypothetical protein R3E12_03580 [Candidatus Eisenbacteria bacterium]
MILGGVAPASAQLLGAGRLPISYRSWKIESDSTETTISQLHVPVVASLRLGESADLVISTAYGSSDLSSDTGDDLSLAGASGVKAQLFVRMLENRLLLQGGTNVPTGATGLELDELTVVQALSAPLLGFRLKHYGEGWNVGGGGALAFPVAESATFALGGGFVHRGAYEFVAGDDDYRPGTEVSASTGLDVQSGEVAVLRLDASYRAFGADQLGGQDIFDEGDQIELQAAAGTPPAPFAASARVRSVIKQDNTAFSSAGEAVEQATLAAGHSVQVEGDLSYALSPRARFGIGGSFLQFAGAEDASQDGHTLGVGPLFDVVLGDRGRVSVQAQWLEGKTNDVDGVAGLDLSGFDVSFGLYFAPGW